MTCILRSGETKGGRCGYHTLKLRNRPHRNWTSKETLPSLEVEPEELRAGPGRAEAQRAKEGEQPVVAGALKNANEAGSVRIEKNLEIGTNHF